MRKDLEVFENRSDDWLAKQRKYEERVSVWDFDEGKKIREEHHKRHIAYEEMVKNKLPPNPNKELANVQLRKLTFMMFAISFIIMLAIFFMSMGY